MESARCLVTGATGFLGRALVARLDAADVVVRGLARSVPSPSGSREEPRARPATAELVAADLTTSSLDPHLVDGIDVVYHLAAKTHDLTDGAGGRDEYWRVNVEGTRRLLACLRGQGVRRVVFASSVKAVSEGASIAIADDAPPVPRSDYGQSKRAAETLVLEAAAREGFEGVCLRFPLIYGSGQRGNLERMIAAIRRGRFPPPPDNGNRRSLIHVENAVDALILAARHPAAAGHVYNVTDARPYSTREIYDGVRAALGRPQAGWSVPEWAFRLLASTGDVARRIAGRRVGFDSEAFEKLLGTAWYRSDRIQQELGYRPARDLAGCLPALVTGAGTPS